MCIQIIFLNKTSKKASMKRFTTHLFLRKYYKNNSNKVIHHVYHHTTPANLREMLFYNPSYNPTQAAQKKKLKTDLTKKTINL